MKIRRHFEGWGVGMPPYTPHQMHEYQNKEVIGMASCKHLKIKRLFVAESGDYSADSVARR
jgi:hypothetical protein